MNDTNRSAAEIKTLRGAADVFVRHSSPRALLVGLALVALTRAIFAGFGGLTGWDLVAVLVVAAMVPLVEWFVHRVILHAEPQKVGATTVDFGAGHRQHHARPDDTNWVLLGGVEATLFQLVNAALAAAILIPLLTLAGATRTGPVLTGVLAAITALLHYEWAHFLFHTGYRPKSRYYRRLKRNHRLHHWRDQRSWLGITSNAADRVLRTYPPARATKTPL